MFVKNNFGHVVPAGAVPRANGGFIVTPCFVQGPHGFP